jgi:hypothetical protein
VRRLGRIAWTDAVRYWTISAALIGGLALLGVVVASRDRSIELGEPVTVKIGLDSAGCDLADTFYGYSGPATE